VDRFTSNQDQDDQRPNSTHIVEYISTAEMLRSVSLIIREGCMSQRQPDRVAYLFISLAPVCPTQRINQVPHNVLYRRQRCFLEE